MSFITANCCCAGCFNCYYDDWYARSCKWHGYPQELVDYLDEAVLNFGPLHQANEFVPGGSFGPGGFTNVDVSDEITLPDYYETTDNCPVSGQTQLLWQPPGHPGTVRTYNVDGFIRLTTRLSNIKMRLFAEKNPFDPCKYSLETVQFKWTQTIMDVDSMEVRMYRTVPFVEEFFFNDVTGIKVQYPSLPNPLLQGHEDPEPSYWHSWRRSYASFGSPAYSSDCSKVWVQPAGRTTVWRSVDAPGIGAGGPTVHLPILIPVDSPPWYNVVSGLDPFIKCNLNFPHWIGAGLHRHVNFGGLYESGSDVRQPVHIKADSSWAACVTEEELPDPGDGPGGSPLVANGIGIDLYKGTQI